MCWTENPENQVRSLMSPLYFFWGLGEIGIRVDPKIHTVQGVRGSNPLAPAQF